jgi:hypothetical protein
MLKIEFNLSSILAGDIDGDNNSISPDISPEENSQKCAQNCSSGDTGYTGDIIHTSFTPHLLCNYTSKIK